MTNCTCLNCSFYSKPPYFQEYLENFTNLNFEQNDEAPRLIKQHQLTFNQSPRNNYETTSFIIGIIEKDVF